jgi:hypothetical protein
MPTELHETPYSKGKVRTRLGGIVKSELVNHLEGKICFTILDRGYGWGYEHTFSEGKNFR